MNLVLGLTGPNAAGKGELAAYLSEQGFQVHSLSDIVREAAAAEGLPPEREHLIRIELLSSPVSLTQSLSLRYFWIRVCPRCGKRYLLDVDH